MKRLVILVVLMAVIVPPAIADQQVGRVGSIRPAPTTANHLEMRRIEIDSSQIRLEGNGAYWLQDHLVATLRNRARATGLVEIAVSGSQFEHVAATQDRIHDSGRYSSASKKQVPRGEMVAPTDHYVITGSANVSYKNRGGNFSIRGRSVNLSDTKVSAVVRLIIEPVVIATGLSDAGYDVTGTASRSIDRNVAGYNLTGFLQGNSSSANIEQDLLEKATQAAVDDFIHQFNPPSRPEVPKSTKR